MAETALHLTEGTFDQELARHTELLLVDFWAEWCAPCKAIAPVLEELAAEFAGRVRVAKLNVDENRQTPARFGIRGIPTLLFFKDGARVDQLIGNLPKAQIRSKIASLVA